MVRVMVRYLYFFLIISTLLIFTSSSALGVEIATDQKLITVDLGKQMLFAWEGGKILHKTRISSGLPLTPTVKGSFAIRWKIPSQTMKGESKAYGKYEYKNVPHVMYFFQEYAIHGAYWHNRFGRPNSHGCVNVPLSSAEWLYNWAVNGTRVEVF